MMKRWDRLLEVRSVVQAALEEQRRNKVIGSSLEAVVEIQANPDTYEFLKPYENDLSALFIVSGTKLKEVHHLPERPDFLVTVSKATAKKCERCWNYREAVGANAAHPTLCDRCVEALQ
jgi:isoleucyl-tRNA synthetase